MRNLRIMSIFDLTVICQCISILQIVMSSSDASPRRLELKQPTLRAPPVVEATPRRPTRVSHRISTFSNAMVTSQKMRDIDKSISTDKYFATPNIAQENTYKLHPDIKPEVAKVRNVISDVIQMHITETEYDANAMRQKSVYLSECIRERVKAMDLKRYKSISHVTIGEMKNQDLTVFSRYLWNQQTDTFVSFNFQHGNIFAVGTVFLVYQE